MSVCIAGAQANVEERVCQDECLYWLPRTCSGSCTTHVTELMLNDAPGLQATKENSGLGANLKQQPGNKNPSKGSIVDESGQAGGKSASCVLPLCVQLIGHCLATAFWADIVLSACRGNVAWWSGA